MPQGGVKGGAPHPEQGLDLELRLGQRGGVQGGNQQPEQGVGIQQGGAQQPEQGSSRIADRIKLRSFLMEDPPKTLDEEDVEALILI